MQKIWYVKGGIIQWKLLDEVKVFFQKIKNDISV